MGKLGEAEYGQEAEREDGQHGSRKRPPPEGNGWGMRASPTKRVASRRKEKKNMENGRRVGVDRL